MIHYSFIGYMVASAFIMVVCVLGYKFLMENKMNPSYNRLVLLSIYAVSFILPLLIAMIPESSQGVAVEISGLEFGGIIGDNSENQERLILNSEEILLWGERIYFLGVFIFFFFSVLTICHLVFLLRKSKKMEIEGMEVYAHGNKKLSSFSWGNKIMVYNGALGSEIKDMQMLMSHEKAHLEKAHWLDLALAQIVLIFQWFNPTAWFMRRELQIIHEYEADEAVLQAGINEKDYQMLLIQNISGSRYSGLTDGLNNCSLKKRIIMMKKTKFKKDWVTRGIAVCGFAILGGLIIHIPAVAEILTEPTKPVVNSEKPIEIKGDMKADNSNPKAEYLIDGKQVERESLDVVDPSDIKAMSIDKTSGNPTVEITTKTASVGNKGKDDFNDLKERIEKTDFNAHKKKGELENYPDAYGVVDQVAEYEGGQSQLLKDLIENINYPEEAKEQKIEGRVVVRFQINTNGTLSNCEVAYSQNPLLNEAAIKAVEDLPGKWKPGEINGKPVASIFNMPVTFKLSGQQSK